MTEDRIKHLVDRFLNWRLPRNFAPDGGVSYSRPVPIRDGQEIQMPSGTNLLDGSQAREMVMHMLDGLPVEAAKTVEEPRGMHAKEAVDMMRRCKDEIVSLRATIERLQPKADAYDSVATILHLLPQQSRGMGENMVWTLDKRIRELTSPAEPAGQAS